MNILLRRTFLEFNLVFVTAVAAVPMTVSASERNVSDYEFLTFNLAHPELDASNALARGQLHCYSVNGYTKWFPGVETDVDKRFCATVERNISGSSDVLTAENERVARFAVSYAVVYNRYIIEHARDNIPKSSSISD